MGAVTYLYVQWMSDKAKEIVSVPAGKTYSSGNTIFLQRNDFESKSISHIHFVGESEEDIQRQIKEYESNNKRLRLPSQKLLQSQEEESRPSQLAQNLKLQKSQIALAKKIQNKKILEKRVQKKNIEMEVLNLSDEEGNKNLDDNEEVFQENSLRDEGIQADQQDGGDLQLDGVDHEDLRENCGDIQEGGINHEDPQGDRNDHVIEQDFQGESLHDEGEGGCQVDGVRHEDLQENSDIQVHQSDGAREMHVDENQLNAPSTSGGGRSLHRLRRYDILNNRIFLGGGNIFMNLDDWETLNSRRKNSLWIIDFAEILWPNDLIDKCLDNKKARPRIDGQTRTVFTPKKLKVLEKVYRDRLKKQGIKGKKALREKIKEVRQKLTQKVNDLNRRKGGGGENSSSTSSTSSEESD
ncbi:uncharacterized protein LOC127276838 isoform X2 [Leptopilina boulardi]|uniref:uncharacterized protein LOC127276838 isoform X2 n=1 Tax=Leptopilina boulardi TaxID=63433 RepID=UPI0021F570A0|nr:uncharacterized protein LOC127276838 isoform X2 [Leptopilina boulardi]